MFGWVRRKRVMLRKVATSMPRLREASLQDYPGIAAVMRDNGLVVKGEQEWRCRHVDNPALVHFAQPPPIGWVLETEASATRRAQIVGFIGNIPAVYELQGEVVRAVAACDWAVSAAYRGASIYLLARYFSQQNVDLFITTTARENSGRAFAVFQARKIPVEAYDVAFFAITHRDFVDSFLRKKKIPAAALLG